MGPDGRSGGAVAGPSTVGRPRPSTTAADQRERLARAVIPSESPGRAGTSAARADDRPVAFRCATVWDNRTPGMPIEARPRPTVFNSPSMTSVLHDSYAGTLQRTATEP